MKKHILKLTCLLVLASIFTVSCNTTNSNESPPQLPPSESMSVDFSEMESASNQSKARVAESNFNTAVFAAGIAKVILTANLAIPKALITAAQEEAPESIGNSEWEWNFNTAANGQNFGARLVATANSNDDVTWNFYVTNSAAGLDNKLFFTGTSDYEATSGTWTYFALQSEQELAVVSWERTENTTSVELNVESDRNNNRGDSIRYDFDGNVKTVVFTDVSEDETTTISYNIESLAGFIISPNYNEGAKSCWDENLNNTLCTS